QPQKIDNYCLESKLLHCGQTLACSGSWLVKKHSVSRGNIETAGPCGGRKFSFVISPCLLSTWQMMMSRLRPQSILQATASWGTGLHQLMIWRKLVSVPGISRDQHLSARS